MQIVNILLVLIMIYPSRILIIPSLLLCFRLKKYIFHMNEDDWNSYFLNISNTGYLIRFTAVSLCALITGSIFSYCLFIFLHNGYPLFCTISVFIAGLTAMLWELTHHHDELAAKLQRLRNCTAADMNIKN